MKIALSMMLALSLPLVATADTIFVSDVDNVWGTASNWDNGLPGATDNAGVIPAGKSVVVAANDNGARSFSLLVESGGSLLVSPGITLSSSNSGLDTTVSGTMTVQGTFIQLGNASDVYVDGGLLDIVAGATLDARKVTDVFNGGRLNLASSLGANWVPQNRLRVGNSGSVGTLHFDVFSGVHATVTGNTLNFDVGTGSVLDIDATGTGVGTYTLVSGISNWRDAGGTVLANPRPFATETVNNLGAGLAWDVVYDNTVASGSRTVSLVITSTVIPEPSSLALLALGCLVFGYGGWRSRR